ncbi:MAG TPA: carboxylating nicotinate-nucleotide diphosphorylase [Terriglobia bacterium]|nr:carboxylating nicotinate-nucleotide diphosphorylase [Terriglobia bacterium]
MTELESAVHHQQLKRFLEEDIGKGDITTEAIVAPSQRAAGTFLAKGSIVLAGVDIALEVFRLLDDDVTSEVSMGDGSILKDGDAPAILRGRARALLTGERVALNLLQRLSGIATLTRKFVDAVKGTGAEILDTRKTTPGLRTLEKYAVQVGGGRNHRLDLHDAILIKENHIRLAGGLSRALASARNLRTEAQLLEVEVTNMEELKEALQQSPDAILLDNMSPAGLRQMVAWARAHNSKTVLEASGGVTLANVREYAEAGPDWISVGALTHSAPSADISFEIEPITD